MAAGRPNTRILEKRNEHVSYRPKVTPWQVEEDNFPAGDSPREKLTFLLQYAILAPSSHNTQPWLFDVDEREIALRVDTERWLPVADADKRELYISAGCALENLLVAAEHFDYAADVDYVPDAEDQDLAAVVRFPELEEPSAHRPPELFQAITRRHTSHRTFEDRPVSDQHRERLRACCVEEDVRVHLTDDEEKKDRLDELVARADAAQFADPEWRRELGYWMGKGVFGTSWIGSKIAKLIVTYLNLGKSTAEKDSELLHSAPLLGFMSTATDDRALQVRVGQAFERLSLMAASLGYWTHPMSQALEVPELREELAELLPVEGAVPQHVFRLGCAEPKDEHTPRRRLEEVIL